MHQVSHCLQIELKEEFRSKSILLQMVMRFTLAFKVKIISHQSKTWRMKVLKFMKNKIKISRMASEGLIHKFSYLQNLIKTYNKNLTLCNYLYLPSKPQSMTISKYSKSKIALQFMSLNIKTNRLLENQEELKRRKQRKLEFKLK